MRPLPYPPVVAGVDGSPESLAAVGWAAREAVRRGRALRLVHAWDRHPDRPWDLSASADAAQRHLARRILREAEDRVRADLPDLPVLDEQIQGPAAEVLTKAALDSCVLVVGSRGLSGFAGFVVGSVALGVLARANGPVVLVRADEDAADEHLPAADGGAATDTAYRDVVLGIDLRVPCDPVIEFAFEEARVRGARLRVVYAWQPPSVFASAPGEPGSGPDPERADQWREFLAAVLRPWRARYPDVEVLESVAEGSPRSVLIRAGSGAGLLVVGNRPSDGPRGLPRTGPVTHAAVHHAGCPVAVVPHQ